MYCWRIVNKHGWSAFFVNDFLTRNSSTLGTTQILSLISVSEGGNQYSSYILLSTIITTVVTLFVLSRSCLYPLESFPTYSVCPRIPFVSTPMLLDVQFREPPSKSHLWYGYGYFLESADGVQIVAIDH